MSKSILNNTIEKTTSKKSILSTDENVNIGGKETVDSAIEKIKPTISQKIGNVLKTFVNPSLTLGSNLSSILSKKKEEPISIEQKVETIKPIEPVIEQPKTIAPKSLKDKYIDFSKRGGQLAGELDVGIMKTFGETLGALHTIGTEIATKPLAKVLDKTFGTTIEESQKDKNAGEIINKFAENFDKNLGVEEKKFVDKVFEGAGSSIPFLFGGVAGKMLGTGEKVLSLGLSGMEALVNAYDDYKTLVSEDDKDSKLKAVASFGANMAVNYITNKLGFLSNNVNKSTFGTIKKFITDGLVETGQETTQQFISNIMTSKDPMYGLGETFLVSAPISFMFGFGGIIQNPEEFKDNKQLKNTIKEIADSGITKDKLSTVISSLNGIDKNEVSKTLDEITVDDKDINKTFADNQKSEIVEISKSIKPQKTPKIEKEKITKIASQFKPAPVKEVSLEEKTRKYKRAEEYIKNQLPLGEIKNTRGFLTTDGKVLDMETGQHPLVLKDAGLSGGDVDNFTKYGVIRLRNTVGEDGFGQINIQIAKEPTAQQISQLQKLPNNTPINFDIFIDGKTISSPTEGVSKREFLSQLEEIWEKAHKGEEKLSRPFIGNRMPVSTEEARKVILESIGKEGFTEKDLRILFTEEEIDGEADGSFEKKNRIYGDLVKLYEKGGKANLITALHESKHFLFSKMPESLRTEMLEKAKEDIGPLYKTVLERSYGKEGVYEGENRENALLEEYIVEKWAKTDAKDYGYQPSWMQMVFKFLDDKLKKIVDAFKKIRNFGISLEEPIKPVVETTETKQLNRYKDSLKARRADPVLVDAIVTPSITLIDTKTDTFEGIIKQIVRNEEVFNNIWQNLDKIRVFDNFYKKGLISEAKKMYGEDLTETELQKELASDFETYVNERESGKQSTFFDKIKEFFDRLYSAFKRIFKTAKDIKEYIDSLPNKEGGFIKIPSIEAKPSELSIIKEKLLNKKPFTINEQNSWNNNTHFPIDYNEEYNSILSKIISKAEEKFGEETPEEINYLIEEYAGETESFLREKGKQMLNAPSPFVTGRAGYNFVKADKARSVFEKKVLDFNKYTEEVEKDISSMANKISKEKFSQLPEVEKIKSEINKYTKLRDGLNPTRDDWYIEQLNKKIKSLNRKLDKINSQSQIELKTDELSLIDQAKGMSIETGNWKKLKETNPDLFNKGILRRSQSPYGAVGEIPKDIHELQGKWQNYGQYDEIPASNIYDKMDNYGYYLDNEGNVIRDSNGNSIINETKFGGEDAMVSTQQLKQELIKSFETPEGKKYLTEVIDALPKNKDGSITAYRIGNIGGKNAQSYTVSEGMAKTFSNQGTDIPIPGTPGLPKGGYKDFGVLPTNLVKINPKGIVGWNPYDAEILVEPKYVTTKSQLEEIWEKAQESEEVTETKVPDIGTPFSQKVNKIEVLRKNLEETERKLDVVNADLELYGKDLRDKLKAESDDLREQIKKEKFQTFDTGNRIEDLKRTLAFAEESVGMKPRTKKDIVLPKELEEKQTYVEILKETLELDPAKELEAYAPKTGRFKDELPEVLGKSKEELKDSEEYKNITSPKTLEFIKKGDTIVDAINMNYGTDWTTEDAREAFAKYISSKKRLKEREIEIKKEVSEYTKEESDRINAENLIIKENQALAKKYNFTIPEYKDEQVLTIPDLIAFEETVNRHPGKAFWKYANKRTGILPKIIEETPGLYGKTMKSLLEKKGLENLEEAQLMLDSYIAYANVLDQMYTDTFEPVEMAKSEEEFLTPIFEAEKARLAKKEGKPLETIIEQSDKYPLKKKVGILDYVRTPNRVLKKIGLEDEAKVLKRKYEDYIKELPENIEKINSWYKRVPDKDSARKIFDYLDQNNEALTEDGFLKPDFLTAEETKVAEEIKSWLSKWADRLHLDPKQRIANYITHIFSDDLIKKEFDEDLAKIIRDKVPGEVYDPFLEERLGAMGYKRDVFLALDAYVKRATRKVHMDQALEQLKFASSKLDDQSFQYIKKYIDRVNLRPTETDKLIDTTIKQIVGYRLGNRPVANITRKTRQMIYRGTLGLNVGSALRNITQGANTFAKLGSKYTTIGYYKLLSPESHAELNRENVLGMDIIQDRALSATKKFWEKFDKGLFIFFQTAERINRGSAYFGAKAKYYDENTRVDKNTGTRIFNEGASERDAIEYAKKMVEDTQFVFGSIDTPQVLQSDIAKTLLQFQSFNIKQAEFLAEMAKNKEYAGLVRWALASLAFLVGIGDLFGMEWKDLIPFTRYRLPPAISSPVKLFDAIVGAEDKYGNVPKMKKRLSNALGAIAPFIPGAVQIKKTVEAIKAVKEGKSVNIAGKTQYEIEPGAMNAARAIIFGKNTLPEAQSYFDKEETPEEKAVRKVYEEVQDMTDEEAGEYLDKKFPDTPEGDRGYEIYKQIKATEKRKVTEALEPKMLEVVNEVYRLDQEGKEDEAQKLVDDLTDEEYNAYVLAKKHNPPDGSKPKYTDNEEVSANNIFDSVLLYAKAIKTDPITAFNRIFTGQRIKRIANDAIIVERMPLSKSAKVKEERGATSDMRLDHVVSLELGGSNAKRNLMLVPEEIWASYTPVENYLGKLLQSGNINKRQAQKAITGFKEGKITFDQIKQDYK